MFQSIAAIALIATPLVLLGHFLWARSSRRGATCAGGNGRWTAGLLLLGVGACGAAALTPVLSGREVRGWWLLAHVSASPVLILGLLGHALRRAGHAPAAKAGACSEQAVGDRGEPVVDPSGESVVGGRRDGRVGCVCGGGCTLTLGVLTAASSLLSMGTVFGQETMALLLQVHRYCGVLLCVAAMIHGYGAFVRGTRWVGRPARD
ncbi:MAG: hypothetical protein IT449_04900 [Phycisphaerales bacterium]|nr:hypothetical protein [Phycisphaerales bacterium]